LDSIFDLEEKACVAMGSDNAEKEATRDKLSTSEMQKGMAKLPSLVRKNTGRRKSGQTRIIFYTRTLPGGHQGLKICDGGKPNRVSKNPGQLVRSLKKHWGNLLKIHE